jgi:hypothetical protein
LRLQITILFLVFVLTKMLAQSKFSDNLYIQANYNHGRVLPEYKYFNYIVNKPIHSVELGIFKKTRGKTVWEHAYRFPEYGVNVLYSSLGNDKVFGHEFAVYPYFQNDLIYRKRFQLVNQIGFGLGYVTKKFDKDNNYQNIAVGSKINLHFNCKMGVQFQVSEKISAKTGLSFSHYSNGNTAEPNIGVNFLTAYLGLNYAIGKQTELIQIEKTKHEQKHEWAFVYAFGGKHTRALSSKYYFTSSISAEYKYHFFRMVHFGGGADLFYDSSTKTELSAPGKKKYASAYDYRTGIHIAEEMVFDRFSFIMQQGYYLGLTDKVNGYAFYNRAILRWKFNEHILASLSMKSHLHILDYPEIGFGYFFTKQKK